MLAGLLKSIMSHMRMQVFLKGCTEHFEWWPEWRDIKRVFTVFKRKS